MEEYFPNASALSVRNNWQFGSHYLRKLYANSSFAIYSDKIQQVTGKYVDKSVFISAVCGHSGSIQTSLSYVNVHVKFGYDPKVFDPPSKEILRNLFIKMKNYKEPIRI